MKQNLNKKILIRISFIVLFLLILCTFLSKTIYNLSLPYVEAASPEWAELPISSSSEGQVVINNTQEISYNSSLKILSVNVKENDYVKKGDVLFEVDTKEFEISLKKMELNISQLNDSLSEWLSEKDRSKLNTELEIAEQELELYKEQVPYDGCIYAQKDGAISKISVVQGDVTKEGDVLAVLSGKEMSVIFSLSETDGVLCEIGDEVNLTYTNTVINNGSPTTEEKHDSSFVTKKEYDTEKGEFMFYADLPEGENSFYEGQKIKVDFIVSSDSYDNIITLNAISEDEQGNTVVFVLKQRDGLFGKEYYAERVTVDQLAKNNINAAIEGDDINSYAKIVVSSSKALTSGETVRIVQ